MRIAGQMMVALFVTVMAVPAWAADDVEVVAAELEGAGELAPEEAQMFREQLRTRLAAGDPVCAGEEQAACQQQLRQQVRACHQLAKQNGQIENSGDAVEIAGALMTMAAGGGDVERAGELVQAQLRHQWQADQVGDVAQQMQRLRQRWRHQTMRMVSACVGEGSCKPEDARVAIGAMKAASQRADLDPRRVARKVRAAVAEHALGTGEGANLHVKLQKRLRLKGEGGVESTGGEQQRYRYHHQMDGEGRRGGKFGGEASSGPGRGAKPGPGR